MKAILSTLLLFSISLNAQPEARRPPVRVGVVGLVHGHVGWILGRPDRGDIEIVGISESDNDLAEQLSARHGFSMDLVYESLAEMLDNAKPEAVSVFSTTLDHREIVEECARRGIHVMVEKPLAVNYSDAVAMAKMARSAGIHLVTNYETTWYPSVHAAKALIESGQVDGLRKIVVRDGHQGPQEIGVGPEFLEWLTDPVKNGAGALMDFGCYGADLITWLMNGQRPVSVTAVTQQLKPDIYPDVDDEATIILTYPATQGIIQASWNWPHNRKDMTVYGRSGYVAADDAVTLRIRAEGETEDRMTTVDPYADLPEDPFSYLASVVRGDENRGDGLSSLETNLIAMEILDAAVTSAKTGRTILLQKYAGETPNADLAPVSETKSPTETAMAAHEKINYVEFPTSNIEASKAFFGQAFGWTFTDYGPDYAAASGEGLDVGFVASEMSATTATGSALIIFYSETLEGTQEKVEQAGGLIVQPVFSFPGGRRFHFTDPSGNEFAVWSDKD